MPVLLQFENIYSQRLEVFSICIAVFCLLLFPYLTFGNSYDLNDKVNGILGDGSEILAVELYYITPDGYKYKMVHYRVSVQNNPNFYADQVDTLKASGMDGFAGDKYRFIDKFQAWIE